MRLGLLLLFWLFLFSPVATANFTITDEELQTLDSNLTQLQGLNQESQSELTVLKKQLQVSDRNLTALKSQLSDLKQDSERQQKLLQTANESLKQYENEVKRKQRISRFQRNFAWGCCLAAIIIAISR